MPVESSRRTAAVFQLVRGNETISVCRSNGLAAGGAFMIEAETYSESERGKGYAALVATALLDDAIERGLSPFWETAKDNEPSRRLARRLGFVEIETYPVYVMKAA
jgi:RimJ/RimL family protein N-acetyltransferase